LTEEGKTNLVEVDVHALELKIRRAIVPVKILAPSR
jgi:hypothetical protein